MAGFQLVVLDLAGTTVNDEDSVNRCLRDAMAAGGSKVTPAEVNAVMGLPKPKAIALLLERQGRLDGFGHQVEVIHRDFVDRSIAFYREDPTVREIPGASHVFELLTRAGIQVALNTGFNRAITDVILERLNWTSHASISSDEVAQGRPFPDMIRELMRRMGIEDPQRVVKVGDTPADLEEGRNAGCGMVVGVTRGTHSRAELESYPHTDLIDTVADLPALLGLG